MQKLMLWMVMLMGAAAAAGQETRVQVPATTEFSSRPKPTLPPANTRRDALTKLREQLNKLDLVLESRRRAQQQALPPSSHQDENALRQDALTRLGQLLQKLESRRQTQQQSRRDPDPISSPDEAAKAAYTERIKELRAQVLALRGGGNRESDQQAAFDNATPPEPAVGSTNQADGAGTTRQRVARSRRYHYLQGKLAHNEGDSEDVLNALQQVDDPGQLGPSDAQNFHLLKAISLRKLERYQEAAAEYKALLDRLPPSDQLRTTVEWFQLHCEWLARNAKSQKAAQ